MTDPHEWTAADTIARLQIPDPASHKYSRGVLGVRTGSTAYPGAAVLGVEAAWRTGIGLVRFFAQLDDDPPRFGLPSPAAAVLATRPETVISGDTAAERERCTAWLAGSGTDGSTRSAVEHRALTGLLEGARPVVVDAGALDLVASARPAAPTIITPHLGEFRELSRLVGLDDLDTTTTGAQIDSATQLARRIGAAVLLKGSTTVAVAPSGVAHVIGPATPWLATAGTGDVLAGILGALIAGYPRGNDPLSLDSLAGLGAAAAHLHDLAARHASEALGSSGSGGPITALDVAHSVPHAVAALLAESH